MKRFLAVASVLLAMAAIGTAAPTCLSLISINVNNIGAAGCTAGGLTFSSFLAVDASGLGGTTTELDLSGVTILGNEVILNFNPNLGQGTVGGARFDTHLTFIVSGTLLGADSDTGGTNASVNETICGINNFISSCPNANILYKALVHSGEAGNCVGNTSSGPVSNCNFGNGVTTAWVFKDISIGNPAVSDLTSFNESFLTGVPEPMTLSMMGVGLLGLGLIARRRKQN